MPEVATGSKYSTTVRAHIRLLILIHKYSLSAPAKLDRNCGILLIRSQRPLALGLWHRRRPSVVSAVQVVRYKHMVPGTGLFVRSFVCDGRPASQNRDLFSYFSTNNARTSIQAHYGTTTNQSIFIIIPVSSHTLLIFSSFYRYRYPNKAKPNAM